jgi:hypothetical protein
LAFGHFPFAFISRRLMIGFNVLVLANAKPPRETVLSEPEGLRRHRPGSAGGPFGGRDRLAHDSPQIPDSPAAFLDSCRGHSRFHHSESRETINALSSGPF